MKLLLCSYPSHREGIHSTFLLYWKGDASCDMWEAWSTQMRAFDAGCCDRTKVSVHAFISTKTGVSISPVKDGVNVVKTYSPTICINGTRLMGNVIYNENESSIEDYKTDSCMMPHVVGERHDFIFNEEYISTLPRLRCFSYRHSKEDGEIISKFFE